jgi:hypothetical protein
MSVGWQPNSSATIDSSSAWWLPVTSLGATEGPVPLLAAAAGLGACGTAAKFGICMLAAALVSETSAFTTAGAQSSVYPFAPGVLHAVW